MTTQKQVLKMTAPRTSKDIPPDAFEENANQSKISEWKLTSKRWSQLRILIAMMETHPLRPLSSRRWWLVDQESKLLRESETDEIS